MSKRPRLPCIPESPKIASLSGVPRPSSFACLQHATEDKSAIPYVRSTTSVTPEHAPGNLACLPHPHRRFPDWLKKPLFFRNRYVSVVSCLAKNRLHTVCAEAKCPNRDECFSAGTATFLIMGTICTRHCGFCGVQHGKPFPLDSEEPAQVANAAKTLNLRHIVITSVTRDDLPDHGADHFAETVRQCRNCSPEATIELLIPDFRGNQDALDTVLAASPDILSHNIETVPRLYPAVRPQADYQRSLDLLAYAYNKKIVTKSGFMVGLGETEKEVVDVLKSLYGAGCRIVTIGQYLQPSNSQVTVQHYFPPEQFERYEKTGRLMGFKHVFAGPFVRSSYRAHEAFHR